MWPKKKNLTQNIPEEENILNATSYLCCESTFASQGWTRGPPPGTQGLILNDSSSRSRNSGPSVCCQHCAVPAPAVPGAERAGSTSPGWH